MANTPLAKRGFFVVFAFLVIIGAIVVLRQPEPLGKHIRNVLLISIDTCRADRLSCYGYSQNTTPHIDQLAEEGVLFENVISPIPMTLPAHSSMFTGTIPPYHGVHDNRDYQLGESHVTLAELLNEKGFSTAAFISAFVLDSRVGLSQGFETYNDRFEEKLNSNGIDERRAEETSRLAMQWLDGHREDPFFLFLHYFDPHMKYDPPAPFAATFPEDLYAGEIAYTDYWIGQVLNQLRETGLYDSTLIVITSDHGEMLGEHREVTHSYYIYQGNIHVPLIIRVPGQHAPLRIKRRVGIIDIVPTVCRLLEIEPPPAIQGKDLSGYFRRGGMGDERHLFCESLLPTQYKSNSLLGVVTDRYKYIQTTRPELYDLIADPGEQNNLVEEQPGRARVLQDRLRRMLEETLGNPGGDNAMAMDDLSRRRLESLGYVGGRIKEDFSFDESLEDPKDWIDFHVKLNAINGFIMDEDYATAERICFELLAQRPDFVEPYIFLARMSADNQDNEQAVSHLLDGWKIEPEHGEIHRQLGKAYGELGKHEEAIKHYNEALRLGIAKPDVLNNLGMALAKIGELEDAQAQYEKSIQIDADFTNAHHNLGGVLLRQKEYDRAIAHYVKVLELEPDEFKTHHDLAAAYFQKGDSEKAVEHLTEVLRLDPKNARAYVLMGRLFAKEGKVDEAIGHYSKALDVNPFDSKTHLLMAQLLRIKGNVDQALIHLGRALEVDPEFAEARLRMAQAFVLKGELEKAAGEYQRLLQEDPDEPGVLYELAGVRFRQGKFDLAVMRLEQVLALTPDDPKVLGNLARAYYHQAQFERVITTWGQVLEIKPDLPEALDALAWLRAACRDPQFRDSQAALQLANRACELTEFAHAPYLLTLAAAHAANDEFSEAIDFADKARELAVANGSERVASEAQTHLTLYGNRQPYHAKYGVEQENQ